MRKIMINNEFINGVELELGKRYRLSDDYYAYLEGTLVAINKHYVYTAGEIDEITVHEIPNITLRIENTWDDRNVLIQEISEINEI